MRTYSDNSSSDDLEESDQLLNPYLEDNIHDRRTRRLQVQLARKKIPVLSLRFAALVIVGIGCLGVLLIWVAHLQPPSGPPNHPFVPSVLQGPLNPSYDRQPQTLSQARARYSLMNGGRRVPPPNFDKWFDMATRESCFIDAEDYNNIWRDLEPFYQLVERDPGFFRKMVDVAIEKAVMAGNGNGLKSGQFRDGSFSFLDKNEGFYDEHWLTTLNRIAPLVHTGTKIVLNFRDEPRVLFNVREPISDDPKRSLDRALNVMDEKPFANKFEFPYTLYKNDKKCIPPNRPTGFTGDVNNASAFLMDTASTDFTTDLYPVMSTSKIAPCFSDVLVPSEYYYNGTSRAPKYAYPNNITWEDKKSKLYWRGASTGGWITDKADYHSYPRFKLVDISRNKSHSELFDVAISSFYGYFCSAGCDAEAIQEEYGITSEGGAPREEQYKFKYLMDVDGNAFSGRFLGLLRSGSLVFKSTIFDEFFSGWLKPYEHYIPVLPDLSDLVDKIQWAVENDKEARRIQQTGKDFADRVLTDAQNDCYWGLVLLEWARLFWYEAHSN